MSLSFHKVRGLLQVGIYIFLHSNLSLIPEILICLICLRTMIHANMKQEEETKVKGTVQWELRWVKIGINRSIMMSSLAASEYPKMCG
jgi:hypothetical protein